ncbi:polyprenyl synthetase [Planctomycetales bacterium]|nr:polyprenyl synthetase [Planctomycetales bacterium]
MYDTAYRLIASEMEKVKALSRQVVSGADSYVDEIIRYCLNVGGKRIRPALLFLSGKMFGEINDKHLCAAAAIELVHTATLIHDDILDGAAVRRHIETVNVRWNAQVAVLAGDLLLSKALELMCGGDLVGIRRLTEACRLTCEGELRQLKTAGHFEMPGDEYLRIIGGKTAPLLACSTELGAYYAGTDSETVSKFRLFGHKLGLAFQMIDDILDLVGDTETAGKTLRTDLQNQKPTLPVIVYLQNATSGQRETMLRDLRCENISEKTAAQIVDELRQSGAVGEAKRQAKQVIDEAVEIITGIDGDPTAKSALLAVADFVAARNQ